MMIHEHEAEMAWFADMDDNSVKNAIYDSAGQSQQMFGICPVGTMKIKRIRDDQ